MVEFAGIRVALAVWLPAVLLLKERGAASPAEMNCEGQEGIKPPVHFLRSAVLVLPQGFHWEGEDLVLWGCSMGKGGA